MVKSMTLKLLKPLQHHSKKFKKKKKKTLFGILWDASSTEKSISDLFSAASCLRVCGSHPLFPVSGSKIFDTTSWEGLGLNCSNGDKGYLQLPADTSTTPRPKQQHWIEKSCFHTYVDAIQQIKKKITRLRQLHGKSFLGQPPRLWSCSCAS